MTFIGLSRQQDDDAASCTGVREKPLYRELERMVRGSEYAPVSCLGRTFPPGQSTFDEFDRKLSDPLVDASGICVRVAVCALRARGLQGSGHFREGGVCVVSRGRW